MKVAEESNENSYRYIEKKIYRYIYYKLAIYKRLYTHENRNNTMIIKRDSACCYIILINQTYLIFKKSKTKPKQNEC